MSNNVEKIKNRLSIVDVVGSYIKLEKAGINLKSRCPFHNEKTPSFFVSPARGSFYCFGCGKNGDIFNFVQEFEGVDFVGSLKILADKAGVRLEKVDPKLLDKREKIFSLLEESASFFQNKLKNNKKALDYLKERGLDEKIINEFRLGFAPDSWSDLNEFLKTKGFTKEQMKEAGMIKESEEKKDRVYDRFRKRIMFPVFDPSGRIIAFSGRIFGKEDEKGAKYINSPETGLFKKSETLLGYEKAKTEMRKSDFAILVEGNFDVLMAHKAGYRNTVAPLGTSLTKEQIEKILRLTKRLVIAFDPDGAGLKASARGAKIALSMEADLKVASMPEGKDPADLIKKNPEKWKKSIREAKHIIEFYLSKIAEEEPDARKLELKVKEEVLSFVAMIENKIDQAHFVKMLAEKINAPQEAITDEIQKIDIYGLNPPYKGNEAGLDDKNGFSLRNELIERIRGIILWQESLDEQIKELAKIKKEVIKTTGDKDIFNKENREKALFETETWSNELKDPKAELEKLLSRLKTDYLKEKLKEKMKELKIAEEKNDKNASEKLLKECQDISKKIEEIKERMRL